MDETSAGTGERRSPAKKRAKIGNLSDGCKSARSV